MTYDPDREVDEPEVEHPQAAGTGDPAAVLLARLIGAQQGSTSDRLKLERWANRQQQLSSILDAITRRGGRR